MVVCQQLAPLNKPSKKSGRYSKSSVAEITGFLNEVRFRFFPACLVTWPVGNLVTIAVRKSFNFSVRKRAI
jgi:hypothetical protein